MLWTPGNDFNWSVDNFGSTYTDTGLGLNSPGHATANNKGANTNMLNGIAEDCYGIAICFSGNSASAVVRRAFVDLLIDPAAGVGNAGSSWSVAIANIASNSASFGTDGTFGYWYYFPLFLKAGTAIGTAHQNSAASTPAMRVAIRIYGKPSRPDLLKVGTRVQTLGAVLGSTSGNLPVTPGTGVMGSYTSSIGTTSFDAWWWQLGILSSDTSMSTNGYLFDVAVNTTNKILCMEHVPYIVGGTAERASKAAFGMSMPYKFVSSGQDVFVRGAAATAPDSTMTSLVYALGS